MPALTFESEKFKMSYSYDTLTVYPKFEEYTEGTTMSLAMVMTACGRLAFAYVPDQLQTAEAE